MIAPTTAPDTVRVLLEDSYATYPHSNGYLRGGRQVVLGIAGGRPSLVRVDLGDPHADHAIVVRPDQFELAADSTFAGTSWSPEHATTPVPWFDIALHSDTLVTCWGNQLLTADAAGTDERLRTLYRPPTGWTLHELMSISGDGRTAYVSESDGREWVLRSVAVGDGDTEELLRASWHANHIHPVPADESWLMFSHEGPASTIGDRMWAMHPTLAPGGRVTVDQRALSDAETPLSIGHERARFDCAGAVVVAYGESPAGPRGLYETFLDGRAPRLVSAGDRDWHCGVSRDGTRMVVDTTGPFSRPGRGWIDAGSHSSIVLVDPTSGARRELARTGFIGHPYHPHPSFTPDGQAVVFNHVQYADDGATIVRRGAAIVAV
ncbi:hypothetical protein [Agreia sp. COWG]|uniref:hypothetical protein n=1 Tax=Agreia sp. COWG TaxID=2773266 RepID=UPI0019296AB1|nr:hypothetical protein [Agreia sp. COWG]CAD6010666.1 conserved protein of unknown function [Agreia sp. COWG]